MPAVRDFTQNYTSTTNAGMVCSAPDYVENDLLVSMCSADTSADPMYWVVGEPATYCAMHDISVGFTPYTTEFNNATTGDFYFISATPNQVNDCFYFGKSARFNGIAVICSTAPSVVQTWVWEYSLGGDTWATLTTLNNGILTNMATGYRSLSFNPPTDWATDTKNSQTNYWVRMRLSAYTSVTTRPVFSQGWLGTFVQIAHIAQGTSSALAIGYKIASASEPIEYGISQVLATNDTMNSMVMSVRDIDTTFPFVHETVAALSYASTNQDSDLSLYSGSLVGAAQSFTAPAVRYTLASAKFYLKKLGSPTGNITVRLHTQAAGIIPTTPTLAVSNTYDIANLTTTYQEIEFTFPWYQQYIMTPSAVYVMSVQYSGGDVNNCLKVGYDNSTPSAAGNGSDLTGTTWTARTYDLCFGVYYWAYGRSTSTSARVAMPTMTTERDNSLLLFAGCEAAAAVPSIIEGPVSLIVAKDGQSHSDCMSWGFQKAAGTTSAAVYITALGASWAKSLGTFGVNPPNSGATVIPAYCASDSSVYISPSTGAAFTGARGADAAPVQTVTSNFGSTLNGVTLTTSTTTYTYPDTGVNSYHAMWNVQGVVTANRWAGNVVVCASANLSGKNILFHIQPYIPADIQTTDSVALTGACGVAVGFGSLANNNYKVWHVGGANTPAGTARHQPAVIHSSYEGTGLIQNSGTLDPTAVVNIGLFVSGKVVVPDWLIGSIWAMDTTAVCGGNAAEPLTIPGIVSAAAAGHERKSVTQQGSSQFMIYQPLQIGNGGTDPVYLELDGTALEFPKQYDKDAKTVNYCSIDNVAGLKYYGGASDTIIHKNSIISSASRYHWGLHASHSTSCTPDFAGTSVIGAGTITLANAVTITRLTINDYSTIDASGLTLTYSTITGCPTGNDTITLTASSNIDYCSIDVTGVSSGNRWCSVANPTIFSYTAFTGSASTGHAIRLTTPGSYSIYGLTFTGFGADESNSAAIYNDSGGLVTLTILGDGTSPTVRNGTSASTVIIANTVDTTVLVKDLTTGTVIENARVLVWVTDDTNYPYQDSISITGSGTTATVAHTAHGMITGDKVIISGVTNDDSYNGVFSITRTGDNSYTYTTNETITATPAVGTPIATMAVISGLTNASGIITDTRSWDSDQTVSGWARKSTSAPYYQQGAVSGTIDTDSGLLQVLQLVRDE